MKNISKYLASIYLLAFVCSPVLAGLAGQTLGACPERIYLSNDQIFVAVAMSTVGDEGSRQFFLRNGDQTLFDSMLTCARTVRLNVCNDKMLLGVLDPKGAFWGGLAGLSVDMYNGRPTLLGGLLGAGVAGMASGVVKVAQCNKRFETLKPAAITALGGWRLDVANMNDYSQRGQKEVQRRLTEAARSGRISAEDATAILEYVTKVSEVLAD